MLRCGGCGDDLPRSSYSKTQLKKHGKRRCTGCRGPPPASLADKVRAIAGELDKLEDGNNVWEREVVAAFVDHALPQPRLELKTITTPGRPSPLPDSLSTLAGTKEARRACDVMRPVFTRANNCIISSYSLFQALHPWCTRNNVRCRLAQAVVVPPFWVTFDSDATSDDTSMWVEAVQTEDGMKGFEHRLLHLTAEDGSVVWLDPTASQAGFLNHTGVFEGTLPMPYVNSTVAEYVLPTDPVVNSMLMRSLHAAHKKDRSKLLRYWKAISLLCARL